MVSTPLKHISQNGSLPQVGMNIKIFELPPPRFVFFCRRGFPSHRGQVTLLWSLPLKRSFHSQRPTVRLRKTCFDRNAFLLGWPIFRGELLNFQGVEQTSNAMKCSSLQNIDGIGHVKTPLLILPSDITWGNLHHFKFTPELGMAPTIPTLGCPRKLVNGS